MLSSPADPISRGPETGRNPFSRALRAFLISFVILTLAASGAMALAHLLLDESTLREELSRRLGRQVAFSRISPGFFTFSVTDLVIGDTAGFDPSPLVEAGELKLGYSLFSLFSGRLLINEIDLVDVKLDLEFDTGWRSNIADLLAPSDGEGLLEIETMALDDVTISVKSALGALSVTNLTGRLSNLRGRPYLFDLSARILESPITTLGRYDPTGGALDLAVKAKDLPLPQLPALASQFDATGIKADLDLAIARSGDSALFNGSASLTDFGSVESNLAVDWSGTPSVRGLFALTTTAAALRRVRMLQQPLDDLQADGGIRASIRLAGPLSRPPDHIDGTFLDFSVKPEGFRSRLDHLRGNFSASPSLLTLREVTLGAEGQRLSVSGTIATATKALDLHVSGDPVDLGVLTRLVDPPVLPAGTTLRGLGSVDLALKGIPPDLVSTGSVRLDGATVTIQDPKVELTSIRGAINFSPQRITFPSLDARFGSSAMHVAGSYDPKKSEIAAALRAPDISLGDLKALGATTLDAKGKASFDGRISGSAQSPKVDGDITSQSLTLFGVEIVNLTADLDYDGDHIAVRSFKASTLGGTIAGSAAVGLSDVSLPFQAALAVTSLGLPSTLRTLAGFAGATAGTMTAKINCAGNGADEASYTGDGEITVKDANFGSLAAITEMAPFLGLSPDQLRQFTEGSVRFHVRDGGVELRDSLKLENRSVNLSASGRIGLRGSLGLQCHADLPTRSTVAAIGGHPLAQIAGIKQSGDRTIIPFNIGGSLFSPAFSLDINPGEVVEGLLRDRLGLPAASSTGDSAPVARPEAIVRDIINATRNDTEDETAVPPRRVLEDDAIEMLGDILRRRR